MSTLVLPILFTVLAWAIGRVIGGSLRAQDDEAATPVFVGLAALVAVLSWLTFVFGAGMRSALAVVLPLSALALWLGRRHLARPSWRALALPAAVVLVTYLHYLAPALRQRADLVLSYAGDYNQYVGVATWLKAHAIGEPADMGAGFSSLNANVAYHQGASLRIGALLLLSFFSSVAATDVPHAFSGYSGWLLALQALAVMLLARRLAPALPAWVAALAGGLYGISPTATWAMRAAFVPQALGLAFVVAAVASATTLVEAIRLAPATTREIARRVVPTGLLFFASWSVYPEAVPVAVLVVLCHAAFTLAPAWRSAGSFKTLAQTALGVLLAWVLASPLNFWWGVRGFLMQLGAAAHGGEQNANAWSLFAMMLGAIEQPLIGATGLFGGQWPNLVALFACGLALAGLASLAMTSHRTLLLAIVVTSAALFGYVGLKYGMARGDAVPRAMFTWNLFKAATYLAPFVLAAAIVGIATLGQRLARRWGLAAGLGLMAVAVLAVALRHDRQAREHSFAVRLPSQLVALVDGTPAGRLLVDVHDGPGQADYHQRYSIYGLVGPRTFVSTRDWQPAYMYGPWDPNTQPLRDAYLRAPVEWVLTDRPERYGGAPVRASSGAYRVLDVRGRDFVITARAWDHPPRTLVNAAASGAPRTIAADVYNVDQGKVRMQVAGQQKEVAAAPGRPLAVQVPVPGTGGLAQLDAEPGGTGVPLVMVGAAPSAGPALDLLPMLQAGTVSADAEGNRMAIGPGAQGGLQLAMPRPGTSRALLMARVPAGDYLLRLETGDVKIDERAGTGFGAYFGPENDAERSFDLRPNARHHLRVSAPQPVTLPYALGFGGWGRASGSVEIRRIELLPLAARP